MDVRTVKLILEKYDGIKSKPEKIIQISDSNSRKLAIMEKIWHKKAQLLKILEHARRGVQNLEKEFSKNHNDMSALKLKIQKELNYSTNSYKEEHRNENLKNIDEAIDQQFYSGVMIQRARSQSENIKIKDELNIDELDSDRISNDGKKSSSHDENATLKNLIEPSPNSNFIKDVFSGIEPFSKDSLRENSGKKFRVKNGSVDRYQVENEIREVDEEKEFDSEDSRRESKNNHVKVPRLKKLSIDIEKRNHNFDKSESEEGLRESPRFIEAPDVSELEKFKNAKSGRRKLSGRVYKTTSDDYNHRRKILNSEIENLKLLKKSFHSTNARSEKTVRLNDLMNGTKDIEDDVFSFKGENDEHSLKESVRKSKRKISRKQRQKIRKNTKISQSEKRRKDFIYLNRNSISPIKKILVGKTNTNRKKAENPEINLKNSFSFSDLNKQKKHLKKKDPRIGLNEIVKRKKEISDYSTKSNNSKSSNRSRRRKLRNKQIKSKISLTKKIGHGRENKSYLSKYVKNNNVKKISHTPYNKYKNGKIRQNSDSKKPAVNNGNIYVTHPLNKKYTSKLVLKKNMKNQEIKKKQEKSIIQQGSTRKNKENSKSLSGIKKFRKSNYKERGYYSQKKQLRKSKIEFSKAKQETAVKQKNSINSKENMTSHRKLRYVSTSANTNGKKQEFYTKKKYSIIKSKQIEHQRNLTPVSDIKMVQAKEITKHKSLTRVKMQNNRSNSGIKSKNNYSKRKVNVKLSYHPSKRTPESKKIEKKSFPESKELKKQPRRNRMWKKNGSVDKDNKANFKLKSEKSKGYSKIFQSKIKRKSKIKEKISTRTRMSNIDGRKKRTGVTVSLGVNMKKRKQEVRVKNKYLMRKSAND